MDKQAIKSKLIENHQSLVDVVFNLTNEDFLKSKNQKWTAGQQLEHIYLSVKPFRQALSLPKFSLKLIWGKANRPSKNYDELVVKYKGKLKNGGIAPTAFSPKAVNMERGKEVRRSLLKEVERLNSKMDKFTEDELDKFILPHPLLGKLTIREMFYFTMYHVKHHEELTKRNLK